MRSSPHALTVRFPEPLHQLVKQEADSQGITISQVVRTGTLLYVAHSRASRGAPPVGADIIEPILERLHDSRLVLDRLPVDPHVR